MTWHDDQVVWIFEAGLIAGRTVLGAIFPEERLNPLGGVQLEKIRSCIQWIKENEPTIREHVVAEGFDWWRDNCCEKENASICTPKEFRTRLALACICFFYDGSKAKTVYEVDDQTIWVTVGSKGDFEPGVNNADRDFWDRHLKLTSGYCDPKQLASEIEIQQDAPARKPWWAFWR